jgi:cyclopropane fatty-acyl-phospholipid synthase-like methyltransferase
LLIRWAEIYANTEILSPIDFETWQHIARVSEIRSSSRVIELAAGKGAFGLFLAKNFGCRVEGFDLNPEFVEYSNRRARELGLETKAKFVKNDVRRLEVTPHAYDLGACLGALYIFRSEGWERLMRAVKPGGYVAVSDLVCKKTPAPKEVLAVFFEEPGLLLSVEKVRRWYTGQGVTILREDVCSQKAWLDYYDLMKKMLLQISKKYPADHQVQREVEEGLREDSLVRKYLSQYLDYVTFIMKKSLAM